MANRELDYTREELAAWGDRVREEIARAGFGSPRAFAKRIGMEPNQLYVMLDGKSGRPKDRILRRIADGLEVPVAYLLQWLGLPVAPAPGQMTRRAHVRIVENGTKSGAEGIEESDEVSRPGFRALVSMLVPDFDSATLDFVEREYKKGGVTRLRAVANRLRGPWRENFNNVVGLLEELEATRGRADERRDRLDGSDGAQRETPSETSSEAPAT